MCNGACNIVEEISTPRSELINCKLYTCLPLSRIHRAIQSAGCATIAMNTHPAGEECSARTRALRGRVLTFLSPLQYIDLRLAHLYSPSSLWAALSVFSVTSATEQPSRLPTFRAPVTACDKRRKAPDLVSCPTLRPWGDHGCFAPLHIACCFATNASKEYGSVS